MYGLNTSWVLWYHSLNNNKWDKSSYKKLYVISNLYDYNLLKEILNPMHFQNGMLFLMRENIFPNWEDPDNVDGCCISFKFMGKDLKDHFMKLVLYGITEDLLKDKETYNIINGISISPKKEFNIVKSGMRNKEKKNTDTMKEIKPYLLGGLSIIKNNII